jgi:hypothetical protein
MSLALVVSLGVALAASGQSGNGASTTGSGQDASKEVATVPDHSDVVKKLFQKVDEGKYEEALVLANQVVTDEPNLPTGYELRSTIEYAMGFYQKAIDDATKATSLGSRKPTVVKLSKLTKEQSSKKTRPEKVAEK